MSISDTANARKYASIAEVAAAQAKLSADKLDNAPDYAAQAAASAAAAASSAQVAVSAESVVNGLAISASESATQAAAAAAEAGDAASAAIGQCIRVPEGELISVLPAAADRIDSFMTFGSSGNTELLSKSDVAILDNTGKIPVSMIPAIAITETYVVSSQAAMLALDAQVGDVAKRTDLGYSFILSATPPSTLANWVQLNDDVLAQLGQSSGAGQVGALTQAGASSTVQSVLDSHVEKTALASAVGAAMVGMVNGGDVQDAICEVYVDAFPGSDSTGATSSTAAVNAALAAINTVTDSRLNKNTSIKYARLIFGKGVYKVKDILIKSGICYEGQDDYSTRIEPETGGSWCFSTQGTSPFETGGESGRLFRTSFKNLLIGYDLQRIYSNAIPQNNIGGISIGYASYVTMRDVQFNTIDGIGLQLAEVWDSDFDNCRFLNCGNTRDTSNPRWSLMIYPGTAATDGCNNLRFTSLHIENADAGVYVGLRSQRIHFEGAKLELGKTPTNTTMSNIIAGTNGVMWTSPRLSWSNGTIPMFSMVGTTTITDTSADDESDYNCNHNRRLVFQDVELLNSQNNTGWYFDYGSGRGPLLINGGTGHHTRYLCTGSNFIINDFCAVQSGPLLVSGTGDVIINDMICFRHRVPATGTANVITLTGAGNRVSRSRFYTPYGNSADGNAWIVSNSSSTLYVNDCEFSGSFGSAIQPGSEANARRCLNNRLISGATYGNLIVGFSNYGSPLARRGASGFDGGLAGNNSAIAVDATGTVSNVLGGGTLLLVRARNASGTYIGTAIVLADSSISTMVKVADISGNFAVTGSGTSGDGKIYLAVSGTNINATNRTTTSITLVIESLSAEL